MTGDARRSTIARVVRHRFSPAQANRTLPLVRRIVEDVLKKGRELRQLGWAPGEAGALERVAGLQREVRELFRELERIGCQYKDSGLEHGLIDFPGEIDGQRVLLCWRSDEGSVAWYHSAEEGFAGRKPIPAHLLREEAPT